MTRNEAKQKVLDAVADLTNVDIDGETTGDYLHFLGEVESAVADAITHLARLETQAALDEAAPGRFVLDGATAADLNLTRDEADRAAERSEGSKELFPF